MLIVLGLEDFVMTTDNAVAKVAIYSPTPMVDHVPEIKY